MDLEGNAGITKDSKKDSFLTDSPMGFAGKYLAMAPILKETG